MVCLSRGGTRHVRDAVAPIRAFFAVTAKAPWPRSVPHTVRHATAVHLLRAGVDINTIRAVVGACVPRDNESLTPQVDLEMKAKALQTCAGDRLASAYDRTPRWHADSELMAFLASL